MGSRKTPGVCACGNKTTSNGVVNGKRTYKSRCWSCRKYGHHAGYVKGTTCERCGFEAEWQGQLDVDHIDGDRANNDPSNLQTLCANCHRLKTHLARDYEWSGLVLGDPSVSAVGENEDSDRSATPNTWTGRGVGLPRATEVQA